MPAINTTKGIAPGKIFYHVYGSLIAQGKYDENKDIDDLMQKIIVVSFPKYWHYTTNSSTTSLFFDALHQNSFKHGDVWRTGHSVRDCGIGCENGKYNLNRIFATKEEAREFISECMMGKFFDKEDQAVYDRTKNDYNDDWYYTPSYF